jgi:hypothetical protein
MDEDPCLVSLIVCLCVFRRSESSRLSSSQLVLLVSSIQPVRFSVMLTRTLMPRPGPSRPRPKPGPSRPRPRPRPSRPRPRSRTRPSKPRPRTNKLSLLIPFLYYNTLTHKMIQYNTRFPARKANLCNILPRKHAMQLQQS